MDRRTLVAGGGVVALTGLTGLAGCSTLKAVTGSESDPDSIIEAEVHSKHLMAIFRSDHNPSGFAGELLVAIMPSENDPNLGDRMKNDVGLTEDDISQDTTIADLPWADIYAAFDDTDGMVRTTCHVELSLQTTDELNGREPLGDGQTQPYVASLEFFDHLGLDETYRFRVGQPDEYFPTTNDPRIVDILDPVEED